MNTSPNIVYPTYDDDNYNNNNTYEYNEEGAILISFCVGRGRQLTASVLEEDEMKFKRLSAEGRDAFSLYRSTVCMDGHVLARVKMQAEQYANKCKEEKFAIPHEIPFAVRRSSPQKQIKLQQEQQQLQFQQIMPSAWSSRRNSTKISRAGSVALIREPITPRGDADDNSISRNTRKSYINIIDHNNESNNNVSINNSNYNHYNNNNNIIYNNNNRTTPPCRTAKSLPPLQNAPKQFKTEISPLPSPGRNRRSHYALPPLEAQRSAADLVK